MPSVGSLSSCARGLVNRGLICCLCPARSSSARRSATTIRASPQANRPFRCRCRAETEAGWRSVEEQQQPRTSQAVDVPSVLVDDGTVEARAEDAAAELLEEIVASHRSRLGENLVGIYLHGSRAIGDHGPSSDIDYLVVVERPLSVEEKRKLVAGLRQLSERSPPHGIEMSVIRRETLRRFRHPAPFEFHFSPYWLKRYERGQVNLSERRTDPDLASHVVHTRERGRVLYGERIESVFPPIDRRHHVEATLNDANWILKNPSEHPLYTVLNLCRALAVVEGGMTPSKLEAVEWALTTFPSEFHPLIREARRRYEAGATGAGVDESRLASFVGYVESALALSSVQATRHPAGVRAQPG